MKEYFMRECKNVGEVRVAAENLPIASMVKIKIIDNGEEKEVNNFLGVYNNTKGKLANIVKPNYTLVQHKEYFIAFAEAMERLGIKYEMIIVSQNNKAIADIKFVDRNIKYEELGEEFSTGFRLTNSYDKSFSVQIIPMFTRLACTNGMIITRAKQNLSLRHNSRELNDINVVVEKKLTQLINSNSELKTWVSDSMKDSIEWETAGKIIKKLFVKPKYVVNILKNLGIEMMIKKEGRKIVSVDYSLEGDKKMINRWDIYNAITKYLTHGQHLQPTITEALHRSAEKVLMNPLITLNQKIK